MALSSLLPKRIGSVLERKRSDLSDMASFQREVNRMFDNFFSSMGVAPFREWERPLPSFAPNVDVSETEKEIRVSVELPGMTEKDITVHLEDEALFVSGERKEEQQREDEKFFQREMTYGAFQRLIPLSARIDADKVEAKFKEGILRITLPKLPGTESPRGKKIEIKG